MLYNVLKIERGTTVDGPGFRTSIYLAGCRHGCPGCHNPQSWDFETGVKMSLEEIMDVVREEEFNVTLTGETLFTIPTEPGNSCQGHQSRRSDRMDIYRVHLGGNRRRQEPHCGRGRRGSHSGRKIYGVFA